MLTSTEIDCFRIYGTNQEVIKLLKDAGFDAYDFSMFLDSQNSFIYDEDYSAKAAELRNYADSIGIICNQAHAPFPMYLPVANKNWCKYLIEKIETGLGKKLDEKNIEKDFADCVELLVKRSIEIASILGAKHIIVHPNNNNDAQQNAVMYNKYSAVARDNNIKIALENMFNWDDDKDYALPAACSDGNDFNQHLDLLDENIFVACVDVGHAEMKGLGTSTKQLIKDLGSRVKCLHIHDNDKHYDLHNLPFTNKINFYEIIDALADVGYQGDITLEAPSFIGRFNKDFSPQAVEFMYKISDYIRRQLKTKLSK